MSARVSVSSCNSSSWMVPPVDVPARDPSLHTHLQEDERSLPEPRVGDGELPEALRPSPPTTPPRTGRPRRGWGRWVAGHRGHVELAPGALPVVEVRIARRRADTLVRTGCACGETDPVAPRLVRGRSTASLASHARLVATLRDRIGQDVDRFVDLGGAPCDLDQLLGRRTREPVRVQLALEPTTRRSNSFDRSASLEPEHLVRITHPAPAVSTHRLPLSTPKRSS